MPLKTTTQNQTSAHFLHILSPHLNIIYTKMLNKMCFRTNLVGNINLNPINTPPILA